MTITSEILIEYLIQNLTILNDKPTNKNVDTIKTY